MSKLPSSEVRPKWWVQVTALLWPPPLETYCRSCRRMVEARPYGGGQSMIPVRHFRVDLDGRADTRPCEGMYTPDPSYGPGQEDPAAAFYSSAASRTKAFRDRGMKSWIEIWGSK